MAIDWQATEVVHPARSAARRSMQAVSDRDKDAWLANFAVDGFVEDPVGPSPFDPDGKGHHGKDAIAAFWDASIGITEQIDFTVKDSFAAGDEVANIGVITSHLPGGAKIDAEGVFVYRVNADAEVVSLRAFWELERAMATMNQP